MASHPQQGHRQPNESITKKLTNSWHERHTLAWVTGNVKEQLPPHSAAENTNYDTDYKAEHYL